MPSLPFRAASPISRAPTRQRLRVGGARPAPRTLWMLSTPDYGLACVVKPCNKILTNDARHGKSGFNEAIAMLAWSEMILSSVDDQAVFEALRNTPPAYAAPAPEKCRPPAKGQPERWTVVTSATSFYPNASVGDMPLLPQDSLSNDMIEQFKLILRTPAWPVSTFDLD